MAVWLTLLLVVLALAVIESTSSKVDQHSQETSIEPMSLGYFKRSYRILDTLLNKDYQKTVQELGRINRDHRDIPDGLDRRNSKMLEDEININALSPLVSKRRVRSQKNRREKLNLQSMRNHRAHALESDRRRRLQPGSMSHIQPEYS